MRKKKVIWKPDDVFAIPLINGKYAIGHVLDQNFPNAVRIALYDEVINNFENTDITGLIDNNSLISLIEVTREHLDYGVWKVIGSKKTAIPIDKYANEQFRKNKMINSIVYGAGLAEDFVNSFYGLLPWNDWYDPNYLDEFLISISKKPNNLLYKK